MCGYAVELEIDHDHDTGLVRGMLCVGCNLTEPNNAGPFTVYRERPPAALLGIRARFNHPVYGWAEPNPMANLSRGEWLAMDPSIRVAAAIAGAVVDEGRD
jgi:hypothetical protein